MGKADPMIVESKCSSAPIQTLLQESVLPRHSINPYIQVYCAPIPGLVGGASMPIHHPSCTAEDSSVPLEGVISKNLASIFSASVLELRRPSLSRTYRDVGTRRTARTSQHDKCKPVQSQVEQRGHRSRPSTGKPILHRNP